ncbi:MAG: phage virion morphogenesis protein [Marinobacter sp.]|nr:phage virion morphogenesis protein [Marinobacter sp.]
MAGTRLEFELDDQAVQRAFQQLLQRSGTLEPVLRDIGEALLNSTRERFDKEQAPDGTPWQPLSPVTLERKTRNADKILTEEGGLRLFINPDVTGDTLELHANRVQAAMMQFGGTKAQHPHLWGDIPARPFLGFSDDDRRTILQIAQDHLTGGFW